MILDHLEHAAAYRSISPLLAKALDFLRQTDLQKLPNGRNDVQGDDLYAMVQRYTPRPLDKIVWESHRKYLDVQYVVQGRERMGWLPLGSAALTVTKAYDDAGDAALYAAAAQNLFTVEPGFFAVYEPRDVHAPGLAPEPDGGQQVFKVVMKVRVG